MSICGNSPNMEGCCLASLRKADSLMSALFEGSMVRCLKALGKFPNLREVLRNCRFGLKELRRQLKSPGALKRAPSPISSFSSNMGPSLIRFDSALREKSSWPKCRPKSSQASKFERERALQLNFPGLLKFANYLHQISASFRLFCKAIIPAPTAYGSLGCIVYPV